MGKKISWYYASLLLIPLAFIIYEILSLSLSEKNASGLTFVLFIVNFTDFFYGRRNFNYFVLTIVAYYVVAIIGACIIALFGWAWMILLLIWALIYTKALTSGLSKVGKNVYEKIDEEEAKVKGIKKLISTPTQREEKTKWIGDFFIFLVVIVLAFLAYEHVSDRIIEIQKVKEYLQK